MLGLLVTTGALFLIYCVSDKKKSNIHAVTNTQPSVLNVAVLEILFYMSTDHWRAIFDKG